MRKYPTFKRHVVVTPANTQESIEFQEAAFAAGFVWGEGDTNSQYTHKPQLCLWKDNGTICYSDDTNIDPEDDVLLNIEDVIAALKEMANEYK